ncbi:MAG: YncE family protein, partial [Plesiomonas sp.]
MRITTLATIIGLGLSHSVWATTGEQDYFRQTYQTHYQLMSDRLAALRTEAENGSNVSIKDGQRYLAVNGIEYRLTSDNQIIFDFPTPTFLDETAIRNIFNFFNDDWELTWYEGGVVAVNKLFGNYDYGNGCLMEYYPRGTIQQGERTNIVLETASCRVNSFDTTVRNLDIGEQISAEQLGLNASLITAVERYQDRLYVSQNSNPGKVTIIDIPSRQVIGEIKGIETASGFLSYNYLSELYIRNNLLYVVSRFSHRIDIFDLDNNHQHVTTLGTGRGGSGNSQLDRAQAVVANDDYVIVADSLNLIKVYSQQDVTPENSLKVSAIGHLQFEGKYSNRFVQMHLLQDYLIVHTAGKNYYIYDLRKLDQAITDGVALAPEKVVTDTSLQKIDTDGNQLVVNFTDRIAWYQMSDFIDNGFRFTNETFAVNHINQKPISALRDVHLAGDTLITANDSGLGINKLLTKDITFVSGDNVSVPQFNFD